MAEEKFVYNKEMDDDEDPDSGLVEDAFDVLPDENTLALDPSLDLDLSEENFGRCSTADDFSDLLEMDTSSNDLLDENVFMNDSYSDEQGDLCTLPPAERDIDLCVEGKKIELTVEKVTPSNHLSQSNENNGKLVSFSKEQARQWRRKRILKSNEKKENNDIYKTKMPVKLEPLLPLPKSLKPLSKIKESVDRVNPEEKLANPLLGGEKLGQKTKRGPIPMKLRALPESFWKEPSTMHTSSLAGNNYSILPPLFSSEGKGSVDVTNIRPVTPPDDKRNSPRHSPRSKKKLVITSPPDTDLLFSLFNHLENKVDEKLIVRRGRPKKSTVDKIPPPPRRNREEDPCIVDDLATKLFPDLTLQKKPGKEKGSHSDYAIIRIKKGNHTVEFPAIQAKDNYPAILNELVIHM